jgi:1,4-dihydroxy-2-naphthoyl-CoA synthase
MTRHGSERGFPRHVRTAGRDFWAKIRCVPALNNWLRQAGPIFDQSLALEMLTFMDEDVREGLQALREKRPPRFPSAQ